MKLESPAFTREDLDHFMLELLEWDLRATAARLEAGTARLRTLGERVRDDGQPGSDAWNAKEILAHIAVMSKAYGVLSHRVATGQMTELSFVDDVITKRDVFGSQMSQMPASVLLEQALTDQTRTLEMLRATPPSDLARTLQTERGPMSAAELARLPLVAHLEQHLDQLEAALT